jgi:hypothetical protein
MFLSDGVAAKERVNPLARNQQLLWIHLASKEFVDGCSTEKMVCSR